MEDAEARARRLRELKERAKRARESGDNNEEEAPKIKFRNYQPKSDEFKTAVVEPVKVSVDKELEQVGAAPQGNEIQLDVAPKKPNWDLKQHIQKKLDKLERRTQQAIVEMIKDRVSQTQGEDSGADSSGRMLAAAVAGKVS
uniref:Coiled-coil domain-containing protein 12 n=2 Tax=Guillardia theta TaxID=55529 RepID=A0A7S4KLA8_GUITH|mmetsp:Transcript_26546/g.87193  ORF Transcript_26546/g.87193 Transcript_26546/m.87193 type:complete len:142 (+) Transcript_26546:141-566(+)